MTYYGYSVRLTFTFSCGCTRKAGPILEKFAYQYARLGAKQTCAEHGGHEVDRVVRKIDGPHGENELGWWTRPDGSRIFLTWSPASHWVRMNGWEFVRIADEDTIWKVVGDGVSADHLGGDWPEPAEDILARLRAAASRDQGAVRNSPQKPS